jgi:DNA phosphorothioation-dependent restriction protein DptH
MFVDELVDFFTQEVIGEGFPKGRRLRVDDIPQELAASITKGLGNAQANGRCDPQIEICVLRSGQPSDGIFVNRDDMVNKRNRVDKLLMFVSEAEGVSEGSLDNSFQRISFTDILSKAISETIAKVKSANPESDLSKLVELSKKPAVSQLDLWAFWSLLLSEGKPKIGLELWRLNLIPDAQEDFLLRLDDNEKSSEALMSRSKPLSPLHERLTNASVGVGSFRSFIESELDPLPSSFRDWFRTISESKLEEASFHLWPLVQSGNSILREISLASFRGKEGQPTRASKLSIDEQGRLVAADSVVVSWTVEPEQVQTLTHFEVQVLPVEELREDDTTPLYSKLLSSSARTHKITFSLDEETELVAAYVVCVSAVTINGTTLTCQDGSLASVESEDFSIQGSATDSDFTRKSNASSIYEGVLDALINRGFDKVNLDSPSSHSGYFTILLNNKRTIRIPSNPNLGKLTAQILNAGTPTRFLGRGLRGKSFSLDSFESIEVPVSREVVRRRAKFFDLLRAQGAARMFPQFADWDDQLVQACEEYTASYFSALKKAQGQIDPSVLWMDSIQVSLDDSVGANEYAIVTPLHPMRLAWQLEFNQSSKAWVDSLLPLEAKARSRNFDLELFAAVTPRNLPWLAPSSVGSPLVYQLEFSNNFGFYSAPSNLLAAKDLASLREFFQVDGGSPYELRELPKALARRLHDFTQAQSSPSPLSIFAVNPGSGRALADSFRHFGTKNYPCELPRTRVIASGEMGISARPIADLQDFAFELEQGANAHQGPLNSRPLELRVLDKKTIPTDEHINVSVVRNFSDLEFVPFTEVKQAPHLRGLVSPLVSEFLKETGETLVGAPIGRSRSKADSLAQVPAHHEAFLEAFSRFCGYEGVHLGLKVRLGSSIYDDLAEIQSRSDWMMALDDFMPIQSLEAILRKGNADTVILDYSPDFIDGFGPRLSISTSKVEQLESIVQSALERLEIEDEPFAAKRILRDLGLLSGRLPLVIMKDNTEALGAIGLAAAVRHLKTSGTLGKTVIIPLDSHLDLFREEPNKNQRCDLLLVKFTNSSYSLEFIEVKNYSKVSNGLLEQMKNQIDSSITRLDYLTMPGNSARDHELQWARWAALLRFYVSRSAAHGLLPAGDLEKLNSGISRLEANHEFPISIQKTGIVVNIPGDITLPKKHSDMALVHISSLQFEQTILQSDFSEML